MRVRRARLGVFIFLGGVLPALSAQAHVSPGAIYAAEGFSHSIVDVSDGGDISQGPRFAFNLPAAPTGLCYGGPNNDLYVALAGTSAKTGKVLVVGDGGDMSAAQPFATGFSAAFGLDCSKDRVLLADWNRGVFDITAGGDFSKAAPFAKLSAGKHVGVYTDSKGTVWLSAGTSGLFDITAGGTISAAEPFVSYDTQGTSGILGIGEFAGKLYVTDGQSVGFGSVWNVSELGAGSGLSTGVQFARGIPANASGLLGTARGLYVIGHPNACAGNNGVWDVSEGGDFTGADAYASGAGFSCALLEQMAYVHYCGDGVFWPNSTEQCDSGGDAEDCDMDCTPAACGDGYVNAAAGEECDQGSSNSDSLRNGCRTTCRVAFCGDGVVDSNEACDDGNQLAGDGCSKSCSIDEVMSGANQGGGGSASATEGSAGTAGALAANAGDDGSAGAPATQPLSKSTTLGSASGGGGCSVQAGQSEAHARFAGLLALAALVGWRRRRFGRSGK